MIKFDEVHYSERRSEEVIFFFLTLSVDWHEVLRMLLDAGFPILSQNTVH